MKVSSLLGADRRQPGRCASPADELRHCFLRVEAHTPSPQSDAAAPNPALTLAPRMPSRSAVVDYRVRENLEWTML